MFEEEHARDDLSLEDSKKKNIYRREKAHSAVARCDDPVRPEAREAA